MSSSSVRQKATTTTSSAKTNHSGAPLGSVSAPNPQLAAPIGGGYVKGSSIEVASIDRWSQLIEPARPSDHYAIHSFLQTQQGGPSDGEFQSQIEEPKYEPCDRLIIRHGQHVVGHVRLIWRNMRLADQFVSAAVLADLSVLPELRESGCVQALIRSAQRSVRDGGGQICLTRTTEARQFAGCGWFLGPPAQSTSCGARELLAHLRSVNGATQLGAITPQIQVRNWRQVERSALIRLFQEGFQIESGVWERDDVAWQWLIGRRAFERIYVAIQGPDDFDLNDSLTRIVGYALIRDNQIVELVGTVYPSVVKTQLLQRACSDAIERNGHDLIYHGPELCPVHADFLAAGGRSLAERSDRDIATLMWVPNIEDLSLTLLSSRMGDLVSKSSTASIELGVELVGGQPFKILVARNQARIVPSKTQRSRIECRPSMFAQLVLGQLSIADAIRTGKFFASTRSAVQIATDLFPRQAWWIPAFDDLEA